MGRSCSLLGDTGWRRLFPGETSSFPHLCCVLPLISFFCLFFLLLFSNPRKNHAWHIFPISSGLSFPASHFWRLWDLKSAPCLPQNWSLAAWEGAEESLLSLFLFLLKTSRFGCGRKENRDGSLFPLSLAPAQPFPGLDVGERQMGMDPFFPCPCSAIPRLGCGKGLECTGSSSAPSRSRSQRCDVSLCLHLNSSPPLLAAGK